MQTLGIEQLSFSRYRQTGAVPKASQDAIRRIQDHGFIDPIVVRPALEPGMFEILSNPEAVLAAGRLSIPDVPVVVREDLDDRQASAIVRDQHTTQVGNPIDEAEWFQERLIEAGEGDKASKAKVARLTGTTRSHVSRSLSLLTLPLDVQAHLRAGALTAGHGHLLATLKKASAQHELAHRALRDALTVRQLDKLVKGIGQGVTPVAAAQSPAKDPDTLRLEQAMSELIGCPFAIDHANGTVNIDYSGRMDVLEGLLQRLGYDPDQG
ncbi:MAG: ParB/RepB/Spo0J family partition protein [Pseudomonadales bacterium]